MRLPNPSVAMSAASLQTLGGSSAGAKSSGKCSSALITGYGREPAQGTQRTELHRLAEIARAESRFASGCSPATIGRSPPRRASSRCGTACTCRSDFDGAELHGEARLLRHVDRVVEHHDAAVADQPVAAPRTPRSRTACRTAPAGNRRPAARRPAPRAPAGRSACRRRYRSTSSPSVTPKAASNRPPCLMLPASWIGMVPRERPMPSRDRRRRPRRG